MSLLYGLHTIGGRKHRLCISFAGKTAKGWKSAYNGPPWKKWFNNPIFHNRSRYDQMLDRYRVWFIFMWFIIQW